ncbi:MAG: hypothetical protein ABH952_02955 [Candidatus Omnitrophota bacterium]
MTYYREKYKRCIIITGLIVFYSFILLNHANAGNGSFLAPKTREIKPAKPHVVNTPALELANKITLPPTIGQVKKVYLSRQSTDKLILHIQDLHCNYEAQKNISKILQVLTEKYHVRLISVEGGSGKIDTTFYQKLPDPKVKEEVADYFLKKARINGTEYFAITTTQPISLYGAEKQSDYDKNLDAFLKTLPFREKISHYCHQIENALSRLKPFIYNEKLMELDEHITAYRNNTVPFEDYVAYLVEKEDDIELRFYPNIRHICESVKTKEYINFEEANKEREEIVKILTEKLSKDNLQTLVSASVNFKLQQMTPYEYHTKLVAMAKTIPHGQEVINRYPNFNAYLNYLEFYQSISHVDLLLEVDKLEGKYREKLYTETRQRRLDVLLKNIQVQTALYRSKLLQQDAEYYEQKKHDFKTKKFTDFIYAQSKKYGVTVDLPKDLNIIDQNIEVAESFYDIADRRNRNLVNNTLNYMSDEKQDIGVLVTGGFHTKGITYLLEDQRVNYVVISPTVTKLDDNDDKYIAALTGKNTLFEEE